jgi:hypothetical protein
MIAPLSPPLEKDYSKNMFPEGGFRHSKPAAQP